MDLIDQTVVDPGEAEALAKQLGLKFYRICVKAGHGHSPRIVPGLSASSLHSFRCSPRHP